MNLAGSAVKAGLLSTALAEVAADYAAWRLRARRTLELRERADWLHEAACTVLKRIGVPVRVAGDPPQHGLVVSNHLSYLDVLAYASVMPCCFVAKQEVRGWPIFGAFATMAGTIFVNRERHGGNSGALRAMEDALNRGVRVVLFPEGTSSDGREVLPFHSGFFEPAIRAHAPLTAAAVGYLSGTGDEPAIAYWGDDVFGTHLLRTLRHRGLEARVSFSPTPNRYAGRKEAARAAQAEVELLRESVAGRSRCEELSGTLLVT